MPKAMGSAFALAFSPSHNRWNTVGGKLNILAQVKAVDGFDEANAADLEKIVHAFTAAGELLDHRQHQPEIARNQRLPCLVIT